MASEKERKLSLIDSMITAMFSPKEYNKLLKLSKGKMVRYVMVVVLLVATIQYAIPGLGAIAGLGGIKGIVMNEMPQFSLKDGKFYLSEKFETRDETAGVYFLIDTSEKEFTRKDVPANMLQAVMISESNMLVYNAIPGLGGLAESESFDVYKDYEITNETIVDMSGLIYIGLFGFFLLLYVASIMEYLICALLYTIFLFLVVKMLMVELTFGDTFKITLFAQTIGFIIEAVTACLGIELLYLAGGFFNIIVTIMLMNRAVLQIQANKAV